MPETVHLEIFIAMTEQDLPRVIDKAIASPGLAEEPDIGKFAEPSLLAYLRGFVFNQ